MSLSPGTPPTADRKLSPKSLGKINEIPALDDYWQKRGWKPVTFSTGILLPVIGATLALIVTLAVLQWQNVRNGALFFALNGEGFSSSQTFLYNYLPTIITVIWGMFWSWIDLDVKRLEPWFQLSQEQGVPAEKSLLLQYPVDFLPFVPLKAAKHRQWMVASSSLIMVLVVWAITPLQNGIFTTSVLDLESAATVQVADSLLSMSEQDTRLTASFLHEGYNILWLRQQLPGFTTTTFSLAPFQETTPVPGSNRTLSAETQLYSADLVCTPPANITYTDNAGIIFDDGKGCVTPQPVFWPDNTQTGKNFASYFIGYYPNPNTDMSLQGERCGISASHTFLAIWKVASAYRPNFADPSNATALFCTPAYYMQTAKATVSLPSNSVLRVDDIGKRMLLPTEKFNATLFESVLAIGAQSLDGNSLDLPRNDIADQTTLYQDTVLSNMSLIVDAPIIMGYVIGLTHLPPSEYLNPQTLQATLQKAYQFLFAVGVQAVMSPISLSSASPGTLSTAFQTIKLVPVFALISQAFLLFVIVLGCNVLRDAQKRHSKLHRNPDSLTQVMQLGSDAQVRRLFSQKDSARADELAQHLSRSTFRLSNPFNDRDSTLCVLESPHNSCADLTCPDVKRSASLKLPDIQHLQPFETRWYIGTLFIASLSAILGTLIYLRQKSTSRYGIRLPSENTLVQQILINLIPTGLSTVLEPVWVLLTRLTCLLLPMEELRRCSATARRSLSLQYSSLPPQLVLWRAIRARHFLLATLSFVTLLANVLTVALSGLFNIVDSYHAQSLSLLPLYDSHFPSDLDLGINELGSRQTNGLFMATANFSQYKTPLPAWTAQDAYLPPFKLDAKTSTNTIAQYAFQATGYAADLSCDKLSQGTGNNSYRLVLGGKASLLSLNTSHLQPDGSIFLCTPSFGGATGDVIGSPQGRTALEVISPMISLNNTVNANTFCSDLMVQGWIRASMDLEQNSVSMSSTFAACRPRLKQALFNITVSSAGDIIHAAQSSSFTYILPSDVNLTSAMNQTFNSVVLSNPLKWHDDTIAWDWMNYLIKTITGSTDFLDAQLPPPEYDVASNLTSDIFSRVFAIQMSVMSNLLAPVDHDKVLPTAAQLLTPERRIVMSEPLFKISVAILGLDILVAVLFYCTRPRPFLPRLPTNLASQIAYFAGSHVIDDVQSAGGDLKELDKRDNRYGYGKYVGWDGLTHLGIERVPYVTKVDEERFRWIGRRRKRVEEGHS